MATGRAVEGLRLLRERTGGAKVKAKVVVDQVYAKFQHESLDLKHTSGGKAKYLEAPLFEEAPHSLQFFADGLLRVEEETAGRRWAETGRTLVRSVRENAPDEFGVLRRSAALTVTEGRRVIVDEPAEVHRLTDEELQAEDRTRSRDR